MATRLSSYAQRLPDPIARGLKAARNLVVDPPPRNATLRIVALGAAGERIDIRYAARGRSYVHRVTLAPGLALDHLPASLREDLVLALALATAPHLFVLTDFARIQADVGALTAAQRRFWSWYLRGGLGEFRYQQGLDPSRRIDVVAADRPDRHAIDLPATREAALVLNGGGKDTIVAAELVSAIGMPYEWMSTNPVRAMRDVLAASPVAMGHEVRFQRDPAAKRDGRYDRRHVPHAAVYMMLGVMTALARGLRYVIVGNERSADFGNVHVNGIEVNHQFSKSHDFEVQFQANVCDALGLPIHAFSILRPFYEIRLAQMVSRRPEYFDAFVSCNRQGADSEWCGECSKCAFIALALGPFVELSDLQRIFGCDIVQRPTIRRHWLALVQEGVKPWECVGTKDESRLALALFLRRHRTVRFDETPTRADLEAEVRGFDVDGARATLLEGFHGPHGVPPHLEPALRAAADRFLETPPRATAP